MTPKQKTRIDQLTTLGLKFNGEEYFRDDLNVHWTELQCMDDVDFHNLITKFKQILLERNEK